MPPPVAKRIPVSTTLFNDTRVDPYAWLRNREDPDTLAYLEAENAYTLSVMQPTEALQKTLYAEMLGRIQQTDLTVPIRRGNYFYYSRTEEGKQYSIYCRKHGSLDAAEQVLLDGNLEAEGQEYFRLGNFIVSPDDKLLAYSVDVIGDETYTIRVKELATGNLLPDEIPNTYYSLEWAADNRTFFYCVLDEAKRPFKAFRHRLGGADDVLVHHEEDERYTVEVAKTSSRQFLLINLTSSLTSEVRYIPSDQPEAQFTPVLERVQDVEYDVTHHADFFFIRTNDKAKTFRVMRTPVANSSRETWTEFVPARPGITVEGLRAFRDHLVSEERDRGLVQIAVHHFASGETHRVAFDEPVFTTSVEGNAEYDTTIVRFSYSSLVTPASVYDYDMATRQRELKKRQEVLGGYDPAQYSSERVFVKASDGVEVPISLVYKKGFERNGRSPALLYGYGAYGLSTDPTFQSDRLSLLDRGFIYAIAHIRGGADMGKPWHEDGRLLVKKNTFTDFIAAAEYLLQQRYSSVDRLAITGGSAGGLLMGAVLNLRPDLFAAVVTRVPFVDALNTELDATLPLTIGEWEEWGNPSEAKFYDYIKSYAPYENVAAQEYPAILVTAGLNDPRVSYWEPAKWVAKLRALKTGSNELLLKTEMGAGHFGPSGRYDHLKETAFNYSFLLRTLGIA
ncbi:MAG: S9 family peptidase [Acidobacteriota bacterium]